MKLHRNIQMCVHHMPESDVRSMIDPTIMEGIKKKDPHPVVKVFAVGHEGTAQPHILGFGKAQLQYFRDAIHKLYSALNMGTKVFHGHGAGTNSHDGRTAVGEVVGKALQEIGGKLYDFAAVYMYPEHHSISSDLDIASVEADLDMSQESDGSIRVTDVLGIQGIALGSSKRNSPAFPGATLQATIQAFRDEHKESQMDLEEAKELIGKNGWSPAQLFSEAALRTDTVVKDIAKAKSESEYQARKRTEAERDDERARITEMSKKLETAESDTAKLRADNYRFRSEELFQAEAKSRKLDDKQLTFIKGELGTFKSEAQDDKALAADMGAFLDSGLKKFEEVAKLFGGETKGEPGSAPPGDGKEKLGGGDDMTKPENNPLIPRYAG